MASGAVRILVLWDIDHTLIDTRGLGTRFYRQAFENVTGLPVVHEVEVTGRTERAIFAEALRLHGLAETADLQNRYAIELADQYDQHQDELRAHGQALAGAHQALSALAGAPGVVQSVLTGNLRAVATIKLSTFDLTEHVELEIGAYGDDDSDRARLVAIAQQRAAQKHGQPFGHSNTLLIGDTVNDVLAAHNGGARILAVATGRDSQADLLHAGADAAIPDLADTAQVVAALADRHHHAG
jgi:phosphoglycolate phosphatase-like HAD superfamily hydrolase